LKRPLPDVSITITRQAADFVLRTAVKFPDVLVGQASAARRHEGANGRRLIGAVDPILGVAELHRAHAERIGFTTGVPWAYLKVLQTAYIQLQPTRFEDLLVLDPKKLL
jgi:hypothetical protein